MSKAQSIEVDCVIDAELVVLQDGQVGSFNALQKRLGRKKPSANIQAELPASLVVYDVLEENGQDLRSQPLAQRRRRLEKLTHPYLLSETLRVRDWDEVEGFDKMLEPAELRAS